MGNVPQHPKKAVVRKETTGKGGRPPYDVVMMFKILVLQRLYNLSDDQTEYQINDRRSFMRFLGPESYENLSSQAYAHVFSANFA